MTVAKALNRLKYSLTHAGKQQTEMKAVVQVQASAPSVFYAKITFPKFNDTYLGKRFKLFQGNRLVWGNEIERPPVGSPLEYRNILVSSFTTEDFTIDPPLPFEIEISEKQFSTAEQDAYDKKYSVTLHEDGLYYSIRGNTKNPKYLLLTFPGFGSSTTRICYAVSYMSQLSEQSLENTLLIAFQDRYQVHGTYMITDDSGRPVYPRFRALVDQLLHKYNIPSGNVVFFGASKGASIALMYMKDFPDAHLITVVPQLNIRYYLQAKSFFRNNLFHYFKKVTFNEPIDLLRTYLREGRQISYFYTDADELSNYSLVEKVTGFPSLTKCRVDGNHGDVAKKTLPTVLCLINSILSPKKKANFNPIYCDVYHGLATGNRSGLQVCLPNEFLTNKDLNVYVRASLAGTTVYNYLSPSEQRTVWYTNEEQAINPSICGINSIEGISVFDPNGLSFESSTRETLVDKDNETLLVESNGSLNELFLDSSEPTRYWIVDGPQWGDFIYRFSPGEGSSRSLRVRCVDAESINVQTAGSSVSTIVIDSLRNWACLSTLISRVMKARQLTSLRIDVELGGCFSVIFDELVKLDLVNVEVTVHNPQLTSEDYDYLELHELVVPLSQWLAAGKLKPKANESVSVAPIFRPYVKSGE